MSGTKKVLRLAIKAAERAGATVVAVLPGSGGHTTLWVDVKGRRGRVAVPKSPRFDATCIANNTRQAVQRIAKRGA